jgi:tetratricopeptide (TPR) repeat protein
LRLCVALAGFWDRWSYHHVGLALLERALALRAGVAEEVRLKALLKASYLHLQMDELERGEALAEEALALARQAEDLSNTAEALLLVGFSAHGHHQYALARAFMEEAAALCQQAGEARGRARCLQFLFAQLLPTIGEYEQAVVYGEEAVAAFRTLGIQTDIGYTLIHLGKTLFVSQRDQERGAALVEQALSLLHEVQADWPTTWAFHWLARIRRYQGKFDEARRLREEALALGLGRSAPSDFFQMQAELARVLVQQGEFAEARALYEEQQTLLPTMTWKPAIAHYLEGRAMLEATLDAPASAARLWGAAEALREAIGAPMYPVDRAEYAPAIAAAHAKLGEAAFAAAWAEGRKMTPEAVLAAVD